MKPKKLLEVVTLQIMNKLNTLLVSAPGVGKTDIVQQAVEAAGAKCAVFHPAVSDPTDYKGFPWCMADESGGTTASFVTFGELKVLQEAEELTVAFFDDIGQAREATQNALMQLIWGRSINGKKVSDNVMFVAATNRRADRSGVSGMTEALKSRFATIINAETSIPDWCEWANAHGMPSDLIYFIRANPALLHDFAPTTEIANTPSPRTVASFGTLLNTGYTVDDDFEVLAGAAGPAFAVQFKSYMQVARKVPDVMAFLKDPSSITDMPTDPAILFHMAMQLTRYSHIDNIEPMLECVARFPSEFGAYIINDVRVLVPEIEHTASFQRWRMENQEMFV